MVPGNRRQREVFENYTTNIEKKYFSCILNTMDTTINNSMMGLSRAKESFVYAADKISRFHLTERPLTPEIQPNAKPPEVPQSEFDKISVNQDVDLGEEMVNMIQSSRAYQSNLKVIGVWSDLLKEEINLLKK